VITNGRDVVEPLGIRPMFDEHTLTERIALDLPDDVTDAGPFKS
jgi:hypothetical protein